MSFLIIFGIGTLVGLGFAFLIPGAGERRPFINVAGALLGAILGGIPGARLLGGKPYDAYDLDLEIAVWSFGGAVLLVGAAKLIGRALRQPATRG